MEKLAFVALFLILLSGCATAPKTNPPQASQPAESASQKQAQPAQTGVLSQAEIAARKLAERLQALQKKSVYFDFDNYAVKPEFSDVIQQQADFIKANGHEKVTLQGNADERGSDEYNLALGEKRADEVRKDLELMGISEQRITAVSFGEQKPRLTCHDESCWKENRRVDFVYMPNAQ